MKKIRIELADKNIEKVELSPIGSSSEDDKDGNNSELPAEIEIPKINFSVDLTPSPLGRYSYPRYDMPCAEVNVDVPQGDIARVNLWFGFAPNETTPAQASDTLLKRITQSVFATLAGFEADAKRAGLFIYPFKIGVALRLSNGKHILCGEPVEIYPIDIAPLLIIREAELTGSVLTTLTQLNAMPHAASISISPFSTDGIATEVTHLVIYATDQYNMRTGAETVSGVRSVSFEGGPAKCWQYQRLDVNAVRAAMHAETIFRVIGSIPISEATRGAGNLRIPAEDMDLNQWKQCDKLDLYFPETPGTPETPGENIATQPQHIFLRTAPLDFGAPEQEKRVRSATLRGIFERDHTKTALRIYGSHHRERWHLIARSQGEHLRLLRGASFRWWRIEAEAILPPGGKLEAIAFELK